jgi:cell division protein FtsN
MAVKRGRKQARRNGHGATLGWVWLLAGLLIGGAIALTVYVKMPHAIDSLLPHPNPAAHPTAANDSGVAPEGNPAAASTAPKKLHYDFYALLPEKEVVIPDQELSAQVKAEAAAKLASQQQAMPTLASGTSISTPPNTTNPNPGTATPVAVANPPTSSNTTTSSTTDAQATATHGGQYLLQAGAFRNGAQADDLKARIAMLGLIGRVEVVQTPAGEMHRVRLGPYATASELEQAKQKLGGGGIAAVAIRVK